MSSLRDQAEAAEAMGQLQNALELWEKICRTDPDPASLCELGRLRQKLGQWQPAEEALLAALSMDRSFTIAMAYLGILNMHREDIDPDTAHQQATTWLEKALTLDPEPSICCLLGVTFCYRNDPVSARHAFERAIELDENYEEAYYNLAGLPKTSLKRKRTLYQKAIQLDPNYFLAHQALGIVEHKRKDFPAAEYHFRRAVELDPLDVFAHLYLANLLAVKGDPQAAEVEFRAAIAVESPDPAKTAEFFAVFLDHQGRHQEAEKIRNSKTSF